MAYAIKAIDQTDPVNPKRTTLAALTAETSIADASVAHALNAVFDDTEVEAALNALGVKINAILDVLDAAGLTE